MIEEKEHAELNKKKWDRRSGTYDEKRFNYFRFMQKRVIALAQLKANQRFLDIGCGTGWAVRYAAGLVQEGGEAYGIDISPGMIERARASSARIRNTFFFQAGAETLPLNSYFFDVIICTNSFHHYLNPQKVLAEVGRVLKPGGRIYILDFTADGTISRMVDRAFRKREPEHVKFYSTREYRQLFSGANLKYVATKTITPPMKVHIAEKQ
jgi:ubiquinone/menaquinone biosynthesis C-methylase UbiE